MLVHVCPYGSTILTRLIRLTNNNFLPCCYAVCPEIKLRYASKALDHLMRNQAAYHCYIKHIWRDGEPLRSN